MNIIAQGLMLAANPFIHADYTSSVSGGDDEVFLGGPSFFVMVPLAVLAFMTLVAFGIGGYLLYLRWKEKRDMSLIAMGSNEADQYEATASLS